MSDDFGNLIGEAAPLVPAAVAGYQTYSRVAPFVKGAIDAGQGAQLGAMVARAAGGAPIRSAVGATVARVAAATGIRTAATAAAAGAAGAASGASAGAAAGSVVPGLGTAIGAAVGAIAPFVIAKTPLAAPIRKVPLVGGILAPKGLSNKKVFEPTRQDTTTSNPNLVQPGSSGGNFAAPSSSALVTPGEYSASNRADYVAGRGFRKR